METRVNSCVIFVQVKETQGFDQGKSKKKKKKKEKKKMNRKKKKEEKNTLVRIFMYSTRWRTDLKKKRDMIIMYLENKNRNQKNKKGLLFMYSDCC